MKRKTQWRNYPIRRTCEKATGYNPITFCGKPSTHAYEAAAGGWMAPYTITC